MKTTAKQLVDLPALAQRQLTAVLRLVELEHKGRRVDVDGYRWAPRHDGTPIGMAALLGKGDYSPPHEGRRHADGRITWWTTSRDEQDELAAYAYGEPRLWLVRDILQFYLAHGTFLRDGEAVRVDGFLLKKAVWLTDGHTLISAVGSFGAACNCACKFCYEYGNILFSRKGVLGYDEAAERLCLYDAESGVAPISVIRRYGEPMANPQFMPIVRRMREASPDELIFFITNGSMLSEDVVREFAELRRVQLSLSVNAFDAAHRKDLMGFRSDAANRRGLDAPALLSLYGIRYEATFVCWPPVDYDELHRALDHLREHRVMAVVFSFPSYSQHFPASARRFDRPIFEVWDELYAWVVRMRRRYSMPIVHHPVQDLTIAPRIEGAMIGSPAEAAGILPDDVILAVDGQPVDDTPQAKRLLAEAVVQDRDVELAILRDGMASLVRLSHEGYDDSTDHYPYQVRGEGLIPQYHFGLHMRAGFDLDDIRTTCEIIEEEKAKTVLLCSSKLVRGLAIEALERITPEYPYMADVRLEMIVPEHHWWGGSFVVGDLYMVDDYERAIRSHVAANGKPDLVLVPATFGNRWGVDLAGRSVYPLPHQLDLRLRVVPCARFH